jgi:hypothetical protein
MIEAEDEQLGSNPPGRERATRSNGNDAGAAAATAFVVFAAAASRSASLV